MTTDLVLSAFEMGLWRREVTGEELVHHSDKGSRYTEVCLTLCGSGSVKYPAMSGSRSWVEEQLP